MKPIIVIPTYNERANIIVLLHRIFALKIANLEVIIVDDILRMAPPPRSKLWLRNFGSI